MAAPALEAAVTTVTVPGLGLPNAVFVLADGTRVFSNSRHTILHLAPSGRLSTIAGVDGEDGLEDGKGTGARFKFPMGMTVDWAGAVVVVDNKNHALRTVSKAGAVVSTLAGNRVPGHAGGLGADAHFDDPDSVVLAANGDLLVSDNHTIRVVTPGGAVCTLAGSGKEGFADGQGAAARFNEPAGLALEADGSLLVADLGNNAIRRVTMAGTVSTVAGNGEKGFADGAGAAARFNAPQDIVVDGEGTVVVADRGNNRLRKIVDGQVTTLAGSAEAGTADGTGAGARFNGPFALALDERGRLLVLELDREDTLRVAETSLAPPLWMGPVEEAAEAPAHETTTAALAALQDYGKMVEDPTLADVVLLVDGERFPAHRGMLAARSEYFRGLFLSGMQEGSSKREAQEIKLEEVSARAFRAVLRYLYTAGVPEAGWAWDGLGGGGGEGGKGGGGGGSSDGGSGKGKGKGQGSKAQGGSGGDGLKGEEARRQEVEREVLKAADLFQAEGLLKHCLEAFRRSLTVHTAIEQLVWAHTHGPAEVRTVATDYFVRNGRRIQKEAPETMQLLKKLHGDVNAELVMALLH